MEPVNTSPAAPVETSEANVPVAPAESATDIDISQGYPVPVSPEATGDAQAPQNAPNEGEGSNTTPDTSESPESVTERLKQTNAQNGKLIAALGLDPMSDLAEQLESGLITEDMLRAHVRNNLGVPNTQTQNTPVVQQSTDPVAIAEQSVVDAKAQYDREIEETQGVSIETNNALMEAKDRLYDAKLDRVTSRVTADEQGRQVNENVETVLNLAHNTPEYATMDTKLQQAVENVSLSLTGGIANAECVKQGWDPNNLTREQHNYFANQAQETLGNLAEHYRELGRAEVRNQFRPQGQAPAPSNVNGNVPQQPVVNPAGNVGNAPGIPNKFANVNLKTHNAAAQEYVRTHPSGNVV